jgi:hypothetical protein
MVQLQQLNSDRRKKLVNERYNPLTKAGKKSKILKDKKKDKFTRRNSVDVLDFTRAHHSSSKIFKNDKR